MVVVGQRRQREARRAARPGAAAKGEARRSASPATRRASAQRHLGVDARAGWRGALPTAARAACERRCDRRPRRRAARAQHAQLAQLLDREGEPATSARHRAALRRQAERHMQQRAGRRDPQLAPALCRRRPQRARARRRGRCARCCGRRRCRPTAPCAPAASRATPVQLVAARAPHRRAGRPPAAGRPGAGCPRAARSRWPAAASARCARSCQ